MRKYMVHREHFLASAGTSVARQQTSSHDRVKQTIGTRSRLQALQARPLMIRANWSSARTGPETFRSISLKPSVPDISSSY